MIVSFKHDGIVWLGVDYELLIWTGMSQNDGSLEKNLSYWRAEGTINTMIATSARPRDQDIIRYLPLIKEPLSLASLQLETIPEMKKVFERYGCLSKEGYFDDTFLVVDATHIFEIDPHRLATEYEDVHASGTYALLCIETLQITKHLPPLDRFRHMISVLNEYRGRLSSRFHVFNLQTMEKTILSVSS